MSTSDEDQDQDQEERIGVIHRLLAPPERFGDRDENLLWTEIFPGGEASVRIWRPDGEADRARLEAFWAACRAVDWSEPGVHEVPSTRSMPHVYRMPDPVAPVAPADLPPPELTDQGLIRRPPHPPAPVADSWRRIEAALFALRPGLVEGLPPGASEKDIAFVEQAIGRPLPDDLKASYRIHDGIRSASGLFYELQLYPLRKKRGDRGVIHEWQSFADRDEAEGDEPDQDVEEPSFPVGAIRPKNASRGWIPLFSDNQGETYLAIDLEPGPNGVAGQVICWWERGDRQPKFVLAASWAQFLEDYADELQAGNVAIEVQPYGGSRLAMKRPESGLLSENQRAWAEAKLDPAFLAAGAIPSPEPVPADPETDRECRAVVEGFIADHHAWEVRWLAVRPVAALGFGMIGETENGDFTGGYHEDSEMARFSKTAAARDPIKRAQWLRTHLKFGHYYERAMAERRGIYARYMAAWTQRHQGTTFILRTVPTFDPALQWPIEVLRRDPTTAYVLLNIQQYDERYRFRLRREDGAWRIERLQRSRGEGEPFRITILT